jgi:hypothetical protein
MAARNQQTHAKRARELAVKEKRERKRAKKAENAALRAAGIDPYAIVDESDASDEGVEHEDVGEAGSAPEATE